MYGYVRKIIPFSNVDGPGNRCACFLQGCNLSCKYCHNPETISVNNMDKIEGVKKMSALEVFDECKEYFPFISGITISGGECTLQHEFLIELTNLFHKENLEVFIDTNGYIPDKIFDDLLKIIDGFMFDIKAYNDEDHIFLTNVSNKQIIKNFKKALALNKVKEVRTVIIPSLIDNEITALNTSKILAEYNKDILYKLIKFRNIGVVGPLSNHISPSDKKMEKLKEIALSNQLTNVIIV